jgi:hypothetical protein
MKTARITFLVELEDDYGPQSVLVTDRNSTFALNLGNFTGCHVIGEPKVEIYEHHRCSMSVSQFLSALKGMRAYGGRFAGRLADLLEVADRGNTEKLADVFHDVLWNYVPMGEDA